jgi:hypothetical protein
MSRWKPEEDDLLMSLAGDGLSAQEIALALKSRTGAAVYGRAKALKVTLNSREHQSLRDYLREGGRLVRDEVGGVVGVRWARATRSGESFATKVCERFVELGWLRSADGRESVFCWSA